MWVQCSWGIAIITVFVPRPPKHSELGSRIVLNLTRRLDLILWYTSGFE